MLSSRQFRSYVAGGRWGSEQSGNVPRSAVVGRLVVANATRLRAKAEAEDEETVFSVSSGLQLKARRSRAAVPSPEHPRDSASIIDYDPSDLQGSHESGVHTAALRDATATASTSGKDLPLHSQTSIKQRKLPFRAAATAVSEVAAPAAASSTRHGGVQVPTYSGPGDLSPFLGVHEDQTAQQAPVTATAPVTALGGITVQEQEQGQQQPPPLAPPLAQQQQAHPLPAGVTQERDREIHNELRGCEDWQDVLDVVADEATCLSVRTAVQALTRLNTLTRGSVSERRELVEHPAFQTLKEVLYSQVSLMNNVQLSNSLYAFAQLQVGLPELLLDGYAAAAAARADTFYPRDIATLLAAAAAMRWSPPLELLDAMGFRAMGFLSGREFDARSIPTLLHSIALLGYKNPLLAAAAAQRLAAPGVMASLAPQGVANSLWALGRLNTYHPPAVDAALAAFSSSPMSYKPQEVANLLWALTAFRHHPEGTFVLFARSLLQRQDGMQIRAADLATLLYALAMFNVAPGARVVERVEACALGVVEAAVAPAAATPPVPARAGISVVELAHMYWGLGLLGALEGPLFSRLEKELGAAWEREGAEIPQSLLRMAFQGFLASKLESPRRAHSFPVLALDALKRSWVAGLPADASRNGRGRRVDQLAAILDTLKVTYDKRRPTGDALALIDIALKAGPDRYVALQVIDAADRCANSKQLLGHMVMVGQVLEKNGWEVRYLRAADLDSLTPEMQIRFVGDLLRGMGVRVRKSAAAASAAAIAATATSSPGGVAGGVAAAAAAAGRGSARRATPGPRVVAGEDGEEEGEEEVAAATAAASGSGSDSASRALKARIRR